MRKSRREPSRKVAVKLRKAPPKRENSKRNPWGKNPGHWRVSRQNLRPRRAARSAPEDGVVVAGGEEAEADVGGSRP
jgi:hypothetical protein